MADIEPGQVITVKDWPGTDPRDRFVVKAIREVPGSKYPIQVDAWTHESHGHAAGLRTFALDHCEIAGTKKGRKSK